MNKIIKLLYELAKKTGVAEMFFRLGAKSPKFFVVLQWIAMALTIASTVITVIVDNNIWVLPEWLMIFHGEDSIIMMFVAWLLVRLPVDKAEALKAKLK